MDVCMQFVIHGFRQFQEEYGFLTVLVRTKSKFQIRSITKTKIKVIEEHKPQLSTSSTHQIKLKSDMYSSDDDDELIEEEDEGFEIDYIIEQKYSPELNSKFFLKHPTILISFLFSSFN